MDITPNPFANVAEQLRNELNVLETKKAELVKNTEELHQKQDAHLKKVHQLEEEQRKLELAKQEFQNDCIRQRKELEMQWAVELTKLQQDEQERQKNIAEELRKEQHNQLTILQQAFEQNQKIWEEHYKQQSDSLQQKLRALQEEKAKLEADQQALFKREELLERQKENLQQQIEDGIIEQRESMDREREILQAEIERLREDYAIAKEKAETLETLDTQFEDKSPQEILQEIRSLRELYRNEQSKRTYEVNPEVHAQWKEQKDIIEKLQQEKESLQERMVDLQESLRTQEENLAPLKRDTIRLQDLEERNQFLEDLYKFAKEELHRLHHDRTSELEKCVENIEEPSEMFKAVPACEYQDDLDEIVWLDNIYQSCLDYGYKWPKRILYAFHTALKIRDWSPITVLAGVSGTGKSKLPELYSHFGGINFYSIPVQPNWDSQQSMLGFFNSIDNKFDATPMLKLLAQSQKVRTDNYPGLKDTQTIILLDEMNLAHIELYFADFLSKLELRRGMPQDNPPVLEIQLGPGMPAYNLKLSNNVLWTGTMNQDETTKSLSDKVLDRGVVIYFPRPKILERIVEQREKPAARKPLHRRNFDNWTQGKSLFTDKQIQNFKETVEQLNNYLARVGRALGHRVWQSIEHYMANHPKVIQEQRRLSKGNLMSPELQEALKEAFEDQLVQKVMPKLRGIESRGQGLQECLDPIKHLLSSTNLVKDFENACNTDFGQFMWRSAEYLNEDDSSTSPASIPVNTEPTLSTTSSSSPKSGASSTSTGNTTPLSTNQTISSQDTTQGNNPPPTPTTHQQTTNSSKPIKDSPSQTQSQANPPIDSSKDEIASERKPSGRLSKFLKR